MATVTLDIKTAKNLVYISPSLLAWAKGHAHRAHRRDWNIYLAQITHGAAQDKAEEIDLDRPRLTAYDIS